MKRVVRFVTPYMVTTKNGTQYEALVNGERISGPFKEVNARFLAARDEYRKQQAAARKAVNQ